MNEKQLCPECGRGFTAQGLRGHLFHIHGKKGVKLTKAREETKPKVALLAAKIAALTDALRELRAKKAEAEAMRPKAEWWQAKVEDKTVDALIRSYDLAERKIFEELDALDLTRKRTLVEEAEVLSAEGELT